MKRIYLLITLLFAGILANNQNSFAQTHVATVTRYTGSSTSSINQAFTAASTSGNLIVVHLSWDNQSRSVNTVTDNKGNTYARIGTVRNWHTNYRSDLWYAYNILGGGAPVSITATLSGASTSYFQIYMSEYSGISITNPLDQYSTAIGSTANVNSGARTTLFANELIYGVSIGAAGTLNTGATFTNRSSANQNIVQDKKAVSAGSYSANFTSGGGNWVAVMATFRPLVVLPVELASFDASLLTGNSVKLDWATSTEINNDYFEVQRSVNGNEWTTLRKVKGAGNSDITVRYSVTDPSAGSGIAYYRLVQFDLDGRSKITKTISIQVGMQKAAATKIYPNPVSAQLTVEGDRTDLQQVTVVNSRGEWVSNKVYAGTANSGKIMLDVSVLPRGIYYLKTNHSCFPFFKD